MRDIQRTKLVLQTSEANMYQSIQSLLISKTIGLI